MDNTLSNNEKKVVLWTHFDNRKMNYTDIAKKLKISRERVRQIYFTALRKLKRCLNSEKNLQEVGLTEKDIRRKELFFR